MSRPVYVSDDDEEPFDISMDHSGLPYRRSEKKILMRVGGTKSLRQWISDNGWGMGKGDPRVCTHTGTDCTKLSIPDNRLKEFHMRLADACSHVLNEIDNGKLQRFSGDFAYMEILDKNCFAMFVDQDLILPSPLEKEDVLLRVSGAQKAISRFFPKGNHRVVVFVSGAVEKTAEDGITEVYKQGLHFVWPELRVNVGMSLFLVHAIAEEYKRVLPKQVAPCNPIDDQVDTLPYKPRGGGLRLPFCNKKSTCKECKREAVNQKPEDCLECAGSGFVEVGKPYFPVGVYNDSGAERKDDTERILSDADLALTWGHIRCVRGDVVRKDFILPPNFAFPPQMALLQECWPEELGEDEFNLQAQQLLLEGSGLGKDDKAWCGQAGSKTFEFGIQRARTLISRLGKSERKSLTDHLAALPGNAQMSARIKSRPIVSRDSPLYDLLKGFFQTSFSKRYSRSTIEAIVYDKSRQECVVIIGGEGANYCHNKGAFHTTSLVSFNIDMEEMTISQTCQSMKKDVRFGGGVPCSAYEAEGIPLPDSLATVLRVNLGSRKIARTARAKFTTRNIESVARQLVSKQRSKGVTGIDADDVASTLSIIESNRRSIPTLKAHIKKAQAKRRSKKRKNKREHPYLVL